MNLRSYQRIPIFIEGYFVWPPAKVHLATRGNCETSLITNLLRSRHQIIRKLQATRKKYLEYYSWQAT